MSLFKKKIRTHFRLSSLKRDGHKCAMCGIPEAEVEQLDVHHITNRNEMPHGGYVSQNGISLCPKCHLKAEEWHISEHQHVDPSHHPEELYKRINSSYNKAVQASHKLES